MECHEIIKTLRTKKGLGQTELAEKIGISSGGMSQIESGKNTPSLEIIKKIALTLNVSIDYLVTGKESIKEINEKEKLVLNTMRRDKDYEEAVIEAAEIKKKVLTYIRTLHSNKAKKENYTSQIEHA